MDRIQETRDEIQQESISELIKIVEFVKDKVSDDSDVVWIHYNTPGQLRQELESYIIKLKNNEMECINELNVHFGPTSTFQEHSISNGWVDEYLNLSKKFDKIYSVVKDKNPQ